MPFFVVFGSHRRLTTDSDIGFAPQVGDCVNGARYSGKGAAAEVLVLARMVGLGALAEVASVPQRLAVAPDRAFRKRLNLAALVGAKSAEVFGARDVPVRD